MTSNVLTQQMKEFEKRFPSEGTLIYDNPFSHPIEVRKELKSFLRDLSLAILESIGEVIGKDEPLSDTFSLDISRNRLRQEQRTRLSDIINTVKKI